MGIDDKKNPYVEIVKYALEKAGLRQLRRCAGDLSTALGLIDRIEDRRGRDMLPLRVRRT